MEAKRREEWVLPTAVVELEGTSSPSVDGSTLARPWVGEMLGRPLLARTFPKQVNITSTLPGHALCTLKTEERVDCDPCH